MEYGGGSKAVDSEKTSVFDGDVYMENVRRFFSLPEHEMEKRKCRIDEADTVAG